MGYTSSPISRAGQSIEMLACKVAVENPSHGQYDGRIEMMLVLILWNVAGRLGGSND